MKKFWLKVVCMVRGHEWSRWCRDGDTQTRFCSRKCGVARQQRIAPPLRKKADPVIAP